MSKSDDYLEQLLKGGTPEDGENLGLDALDEDIFGDADFLQEFEAEMEKLENEPADIALEDMLSADMEETGNQEDVLSLFGDVNDILDEEATDSVFSEMVQEVVEEPAVSNNAATEEDPDVLKILEGLEGIDLELDDEEQLGASDAGGQDFSALEGFLAASAAPEESDSPFDSGEILSIDLDDLENLDAEINLDIKEEKKDGNKKDKKKDKKKEKQDGEKTGFMSKLGRILFGEDDDDEDAGKEKLDLPEDGIVIMGDASESDLALFGEGNAKEDASSKKGKKEKKKKEKKEKKAKPKKEKKPRPKKEKKPKPPKEPDNTPPLPKKPVILIFIMAASIVTLVLLGADLLGYSNQMADAKNKFAKKNYSEAFALVSGLDIKEDDAMLYGKYQVMAMVSAELEAYESFMQAGIYDMALDSLVRTVGRAQKYREEAELYGCGRELDTVEAEAEEMLNTMFGLSKEKALEFYGYRTRKEYSTAILMVIKSIGLDKVAE